MGKYVWPCPSYSYVSSGYGNRKHPIYGGIKFHDGIDLAAAGGEPILAFGSGTVKISGWVNGYGNYISIDHGNGLTSFYGHASALYVSAGETVKAGQKIAAVGTTGDSTGTHLHFGIHKNEQSVNPQDYVKESDTVSNYMGNTAQGKSASKAKNIVPALFTAYFPSNSGDNGGFLDCVGNPLDPSQNTCAAPKSVPYGAKMTILEAEGESRLNGKTFRVNDTGSAITIENGVYHFDILMSSAAECYEWGKRRGRAALDLDGDGGDVGIDETQQESKPESKPITTVKVQSITGVTGTRKEILWKAEEHLQNGAEILIQNNNGAIQRPVVKEDIVWETVRAGKPSSLKFTVIKDETLNFHEGNPVSFRLNNTGVFYGYVFQKSRSDKHFIDVVCYDQLRYFKNKDTLSYEDKTYAELLKMLADDYSLKCGTVADTSYKIPHRIEDGTVFDILANAADLTILNTGKVFILYDDYGKLTLKPLQDMILPILIDQDTAQDYTYISSIDKDVYTRIKLAFDNKETGEREVYVTNDTANQSRWGVLQYYEKIDNALSSADLSLKAKSLLSYYNVIRRELTVKKIVGNYKARAGCMVAVKMGLGDINISNYMLIEKAKHTFSHGLHTMDLSLSGVRGEFQI